MASYLFKAKVWLYPGAAAWHFVTVSEKISATLKKRYGAHARGFGSLPVSVKIGVTSWTTSVFPDTQSGTYLLPIKMQVRRKEAIGDGDVVRVQLSVRE